MQRLGAWMDAVIFDLDGVVSDTQSLMSIIESDLLHEYGIDIPPDEITRRYSGVISRDMFTDVFSRSGRDVLDMEELVRERRRRVDERIEGNITEVPGTRFFIESLSSRGIPLAIASSSRTTFISRVLASLGLSERFSAIASAEEVPNGKPHPDVFLLAAKRLGVSPERCVVIEDGLNGMIGAKRAGMKCVGLVRGKGGPVTYPVDRITDDLSSLDIGSL